VPPEVFETIKKIVAMRGLGRDEAERLLENPTLENVRRFLSLKALL